MSHQHDHADAHDSGHGHADHGHSAHGHADHHHEPASVSRLPHHDWRVWVVVIWMLIGMGFYILSGDEQLNPNGPPGEPVVPAGE